MATLQKMMAVLMSTILLAACQQADRDETGEIVTSGELDVFSVKVGDCTNDPSDDYEDELYDVDAVPCSEPHDNEFYAAFNVSYDEFPGSEVIAEAADQECFDRFEDFAGIDYESSVLEIFPLYPTAGSWDAGDREILCAVFHMEYEKLEGSVKGLGI